MASSIAKLHLFLSTEQLRYQWDILIVDNGSTDRTPSIVKKLTQDYENVRCLQLQKRGRGRALRKAWLESNADILCYMDVDLSTELAALAKSIKAVSQDHYDIAIASRIIQGAQVVNRSLHREFISRIYSLIVRGMFCTRIQDYQCGFKVINRQAARTLTPLVQDTEWFFDTELLILAEKNGYRIKEIPVKWTDDPDTKVKIVTDVYRSIKVLLRLRLGGLRKSQILLNKKK